MKKYFKIEIETNSAEEAEMIMAELSEIHFYAFEHENNLLNAYINEEDFDEEKLKEILPADFVFSKNIIEEENWNEQWESSIQPVIINDFAAVRPSFSKPINNVRFDLVVTPKMSFGTGHHATTFLMIELMETLDFQNRTVLDFGTGTAVLAILADKCGASKVVAIDHDAWSINNALENIEANDCLKISVKHQSDLSGIEPVDIILANINLNVLKNNSSLLKTLLKPGAFLLVSGFLATDERSMELIFEEKNLVKKSGKQRGDWLALLFQNVEN
ncbi:MAG TPA: 50S ribosomal protein L11 methyltransferase [Hanamia sp.]|nr:50S ribosomal protein L11 methyltransferase [Hanamia sp.]